MKSILMRILRVVLTTTVYYVAYAVILAEADLRNWPQGFRVAFAILFMLTTVYFARSGERTS